MAGLYEKLKAYGASDAYPYHMPGHKRNGNRFCFENPFSFDITEIDGFDNLHHAEGILREAMDEAAEIYGAEKSYFLVNGSSCGILAAISACVKRGGTILIARNCHKSAYHAMLLRGLTPVYLWPETSGEWGFAGGFSAEYIRKMLEEHPEAEAVFITSPTYEGICSDISKIAEIVHDKHIPLIVDGAHGAHFNFEEHFPTAGIRFGADIVIESLHKTLPSLTQTAILHKKSALVSEKRLEQFLQIYQSSSPSYVLMASIDSCISFMGSAEGRAYMKDYTERLLRLRENIEKLPGIDMLSEKEAKDLCGADLDISKLVLKAEGFSGTELYDRFRLRFLLQPEMHTETYVIMMTGPGDTEEGFHRIHEALVKISGEIQEKGGKRHEDTAAEMPEQDAEEGSDKMPEQDSKKILQPESAVVLPKTRQILSPADADEAEKVFILWKDAEGETSAEFAYIYPPGIPILVPGEYISGEILEVIGRYQREGLEIQGPADTEGKKIGIVRKEQRHG